MAPSGSKLKLFVMPIGKAQEPQDGTFKKHGAWRRSQGNGMASPGEMVVSLFHLHESREQSRHGIILEIEITDSGLA